MAAVVDRSEAAADTPPPPSALGLLREGFAIFDAELRLRSCNERFAQLGGYPSDLCRPGTPYAEFVRFEYARDRPTTGRLEAAVERRVARLAARQAATFDERRADGTVLSVALTPLPDGGTLLSTLDATALRAEERAFAAINESLRAVADEAPVMLCLVDADDRLVYVNRGFLAFVGHSFEELIARGWEADLHPADVHSVLDTVGRSFLARRPYDHEYRLRRHDGVYRWMREVGRPRFAVDGAFLGFVSSVEDVTESKAARDMLRVITDEAPVMLSLADVDNLAVYINRRYRDFVGRPGEAILGRGWERDIHPDDLPRVLESAVEAHSLQRDNGLEYRMRRHDGAWRWVREVVVARFAPDGTFLGNVSAVEDITERKAAETALRESQDLLRVITDEAPVMLCLVDSESRGVYINKRARAFIGRPLETIVGYGWKDDIHPDDLPWMEDAMRASNRERQPYEMEYRMRRHDGAWRWVREVGLPRTAPDGSFAGYVSSIEDVTDAKTARDMLRIITEEAPVMLSMTDADDRLIFLNRRNLAFVGRPGEYILGRGWERDVHPEDLPGLLAISKEAHRQHRNHEVEYRLRRYDGAYRWIREICVARYEPDGAFAGFVSALEDVTEGKAARDMMRVMSDEAPVMLNLTDAEDRLIFVNNRTLDFVGRPPDQFLGRGWERDVHPEDLPWLLKAADEFHRKRQNHEIEYRMRRHDGVFRWMRAVAVARFAADGSFLGFVEAIEDVTEARAAKEELGRQREALHQSEKLAALGSLLAGVAHELNNPLSIVVSHAQLLQEMAPDAKTAARAGKIHAAAERCAKIVKTFLAMARRRPAEQTRVDLNAIARSALEVVGYGVRSAGIEVQLDLPADLPGTWADGDQLQQVVTNLVVNAEQAMAEQDAPRRLRIATRFDAAARRLRLEVADTGPGVPPAIRSRIFEPFFTTKSVGVGTGVGLSLCHGIVESHGGTIGVADAPGGGALFVVTLPYVPSRADGPATAATEDAEPIVAPQSILVVDDEAEIAEALAEILADAGHRVEIAPNGKAALACVAGGDYSLILSDLRMPELDGPALYRLLTERDPGWAARMIFITGDTLSPAGITFLEKARRPCIEKPFNPRDVRRVVAEALAALHAG